MNKVFFILFLTVNLFGQQKEYIWFHKLDENLGLPANKVGDLFSDSEGFVWIGSHAGLSRFDGKSLKIYRATPGDSSKLQNDFIAGGFFEDSNKNIWFCTDNSIACFNRKKNTFSDFYVVNEKGFKSPGSYYGIFLERDTFLWVKTGDKLIYKFNIHDFSCSQPLGKITKNIRIIPGVLQNGKLKYIFVIDSSILPGVEVLTFGPGDSEWNSKIYFDARINENPSLHVHDLFFEKDSLVWMGIDSGLMLWNLNSGKMTHFPIKETVNGPKRFKPLNKGAFIVLDAGVGLYKFDKSNGKFAKLESKLVDNQDYNLNFVLAEPFVDNKKNIWLGLDDEGLVYGSLEKTKVKSVPKWLLNNGTKNYEFRTILKDNKNRIWCSTFNDGIFLVDQNGSLIHHYHPNLPGSAGLFDKQINHMLFDHIGNLWVGTSKGVEMLQRQTNQFIKIADAEGNHVPYIVYFYQLANGEILATSLQQGIYKIELADNTWTLRQVYVPQNDEDLFTTIFQDSKDRIFICHKYSEIVIFNFNNGKLEWIKELPIQGFVNGFIEDRINRCLWVGMSSGLIKLDINNLEILPQPFSYMESLQQFQIQSMVMDNDRDIWLGTTQGLLKYLPSLGKVQTFTLADGIQSTQFDALAAMKYSDNSLWFGGNNGITIVEPDQIHFLQEPPIVQLTDIRINDLPPEGLRDEITWATNLTELKNIHRTYDDNTLSFGFVAIDYSDPTSTQLKYKMEGIDEDWVLLEKGAPGFARYPKMPEGSYTFQILGANSDGVWAKDPYLLKITVDPPYWRTLWFRTLVGTGIFMVISLFFFLWIWRVREKEQLNTRVAENKLAALRAQMNPHFIFNSLNSINGFILGKKTTEASNYLVRFSKLMRMILDFSRQPFVALEEEIELIRLYLEVEGMRLKIPFSYDIRVSEELDPFEVQVPTMVIQPFIENAIVHGLSSKAEGEGRVEVEILEENNQCLKCIIRDNGIGRQKAAAIQAQKGRKHQSHAMEINRERLALLSKGTGMTFTFSVEDLTDNQGAPTGTQISMLLPYH